MLHLKVRPETILELSILFLQCTDLQSPQYFWEYFQCKTVNTPKIVGLHNSWAQECRHGTPHFKRYLPQRKALHFTDITAQRSFVHRSLDNMAAETRAKGRSREERRSRGDWGWAELGLSAAAALEPPCRRRRATTPPPHSRKPHSRHITYYSLSRLGRSK